MSEIEQPDIRLHLSDETLARVDEERGSVPRVRWIRDLIEDRLTPGASTSTTGGYPSGARKVSDLAPPPRGPAPGGACSNWKPRPGTARCFNCGQSLSRHEVTA